MKRVVFFTLPALVLANCGDEFDIKVDPSIDHLLTISEGVYGQITTYDDIGQNPVENLSNFGVEVFTEEPSSDPNDAAVPHASAFSDDQGFYEIALDAGDYWLCTRFRRCVTATVPAGKLARWDYEFGVGPGWRQVPDQE